MPQVLISVTNKEGIVEFAKGLEKLGWIIISTGGTFKVLAEAGIKNLKKIEEITAFPEMMDGRVKTLHPKVFGGILADRTKDEHLKQAEQNQIGLIDLVVCNLYEFSKTATDPTKSQEEIIENIDIGGPSLIRAAAKNYQSVLVVVEPADYEQLLSALQKNDELEIKALKEKLAYRAFAHTAAYDSAIANYFSRGESLNLNFKKLYDLRYGENPHQSARFYKDLVSQTSDLGSIMEAEVLHGKELSYNNIIDADAALNLIREFSGPAAAVIKHTNPCGCATAKDIDQAFLKAYAADAKSAFGGVIVLNRDCTLKIAEEINKVFVEVILAPNFEPGALEILKQKKNVRILKLGQIQNLVGRNVKEYRKVIGGLLEQDYNSQNLNQSDLHIVTRLQPDSRQIVDLLFAWQIVKHVKSNAIVIVKNGVTLGIGAGQMSRIDAVDIALNKAGQELAGAVAASDAFFPFKDSVDKLAQNGIKSIIQPGGSIKDDEIIAAADELGLSMFFTGHRAFKH